MTVFEKNKTILNFNCCFVKFLCKDFKIFSIALIP